MCVVVVGGSKIDRSGETRIGGSLFRRVLLGVFDDACWADDVALILRVARAPCISTSMSVGSIALSSSSTVVGVLIAFWACSKKRFASIAVP